MLQNISEKEYEKFIGINHEQIKMEDRMAAVRSVKSTHLIYQKLLKMQSNNQFNHYTTYRHQGKYKSIKKVITQVLKLLLLLLLCHPLRYIQTQKLKKF